MCGIYKIENNLNHHIYIGQSVNILDRWRHHKTRAFNKSDTSYNSSLYKAFRKYGLENFSFQIVEECDRNSLNEREKFWIKYYDAYDNGYNETEGGNSGSFQKISLEILKEIKNDLKNTSLYNYKIGQKYGVSENLVSGINTGYYWYMDNEEYPIRKRERKDLKENSIKNNPSKKISENDLINLLTQEKGNFTKVGRLLGVTDNAIRKWCKSYNLPFHSKDYK